VSVIKITDDDGDSIAIEASGMLVAEDPSDDDVDPMLVEISLSPNEMRVLATALNLKAAELEARK
jgi:hypothetical protein